MVALLSFVAWMIPGAFVSRWWFKQHWPERRVRYGSSGMEPGTIVAWTAIIAFFWLYFGVGYVAWRGARKFYGA